jgi:hypothetical protein
MEATLKPEVAMLPVVARSVRALPFMLAALALLPARGEGQLRTLSRAVPSPQGVTATYTSNGVQVTWQPMEGVAGFEILRGPDGTTTGTLIGRARSGVFTFVDAGFNAQAGYQVAAVASDGRKGYSTIVLYTPPQTLVTATRIQTSLPLTSLTIPAITTPPRIMSS